MAIGIARNNYGASVFGAGGYHISNVYFWGLAVFMRAFGLDLVGARTLGAVCSAITLRAVLCLCAIVDHQLKELVHRHLAVKRPVERRLGVAAHGSACQDVRDCVLRHAHQAS